MKHQLILARTDSGCAAVILNQVVVAEACTTREIDDLVATAAQRLAQALRIRLITCEIKVPDEMDGKWEWPDLIALLPPVQAHIESAPLTVYCSSFGGVHEDTQFGPGDAWDDLEFFTEPPVAGTPYLILTPAHQHMDEDALVEELALGVLGYKADHAPGVNWNCNRTWTINDVRSSMRDALEAANVIQPKAVPVHDHDVPDHLTKDALF